MVYILVSILRNDMISLFFRYKEIVEKELEKTSYFSLVNGTFSSCPIRLNRVRLGSVGSCQVKSYLHKRIFRVFSDVQFNRTLHGLSTNSHVLNSLVSFKIIFYVLRTKIPKF